MAEPIIFKPSTRKGPILIVQDEVSPPTITLANGKVIQAVKADRAGGVYNGHEGKQWVFPNDVLGQQNAVLTVGGKTQTLGNTNLSYRGGSVGSLSESNKGAIGDASSVATGPGGSGPFGSFTPGAVGQFGVAPAFIGDMFPAATTIPGAAYQYIDPIQFGKEFNPFARSELAKNLEQSSGFALDAIDTEFQGLSSFVPKSAALKRGETAADNAFNQQQRTAQITSAIPDVLGDLNANAAQLRTYSEGGVPNSVVDKALQLGTASAAADVASASGFGVNSSAARKVSDLMSAKDRIALSQYGIQGLSQNAAQRAELQLAPTAYSNAGAQINVNPSVSPTQLQGQYFSALNTATGIPASTAFQSNIGQSQFQSNLQQQTQQFNANNLNQFALSQFGYLNSYVNSVAGAYQGDINTQVGIGQQNAATQTAANSQQQQQQQQLIQSILGAFTTGAALLV